MKIIHVECQNLLKQILCKYLVFIHQLLFYAKLGSDGVVVKSVESNQKSSNHCLHNMSSNSSSQNFHIVQQKMTEAKLGSDRVVVKSVGNDYKNPNFTYIH